MSKIASDSGNNKLANMVALGALSNVFKSLNESILAKALEKVLGESKKHLLDANLKAIKLGLNSFALA